MRKPRLNKIGVEMETAGDRLQQLQDAASRKLKRRLSNRQVARDLRITPTTWASWKYSEELPSKDRYVQVARYFSESHGIETHWRWIRDGSQAQPAQPLDWKLILDLTLEIRAVCEAQDLAVNDEDNAHLISKLYPVAEQAGEVDPETVRSYVEMVARSR